MSTILPYPGGKHYGVKTLLPLVPPNVKVMSPFAGGCSLELAIADPLNNRSFIYHDVRVQAYDIFEPLVVFWQAILHDAPSFSETLLKYTPLTKSRHRELQDELRAWVNGGEQPVDAAAKYYAAVRASFSGMALKHGFSTHEVTRVKKRVRRAKLLAHFCAPLLKVDYGDFTDTIPNHPDEFLYCDPPYALSLEVARKRKEDDLYGMAGSLHRDFDHAALRDLLVDREGWLLSYNDCKEVRQWYEGCWIEERTWRHSIDSGAKMGKELVIRP